MESENDDLKNMNPPNMSFRLWRFSNSFLLIVGLLFPWLNSTNLIGLFISTYNSFLIQNDQNVRVLISIFLLVGIFCLVTYPFLNLIVLFNRKYSTNYRGLLISFSVLFLFIIVFPIYLASILHFQLLPVLSYGYWLVLIGLISSAVLELRKSKSIANGRSKLAGYFIFTATVSALLLCASILATISVYAGAKSNPIAFTNGLLIDGIGNDPVPNATLLVNAGKIEFIGKLDRQNLPNNYQIIDLQGRAIMPGIINAHVHEGYDPNNLEIWVQSGITTVCDLGAPVTYPFTSPEN